MAPDEEERARLLTFVVVGAGPTGVEMAGQIAEIARDTRRDFRAYDTSDTRVLLVEAGDRVLAAFAPKLSQKAAKALESLGVTPMVDHTVTDIDADGVVIGDERIRAGTIIWAAGVLASSVVGRAGRGVRRRGRQRRPAHRRARPLAPRPPRGARASATWCRCAGRTRSRASRRWRCRWGATRRKLIRNRLRSSDTQAVQVQGQGQPGHDRAGARGRRTAAGDPRQRLPRLGAVARDPPLLPDRIPEPPAGPAPLELQLPHARARDAADHRREEYAVAVIYWPCAHAVRRHHRRQPAADPRSAARARALGRTSWWAS